MLDKLLDANTTTGMIAFNVAGIIGIVCIGFLFVMTVRSDIKRYGKPKKVKKEDRY